jgi:hypothetical protein
MRSDLSPGRLEHSLPMVWPSIYAAFHRRIDPEVLLHRSQATVLDRGAPLDDAGDRGGSALGRLPKGVSHERARRLRGIPITEIPFASWGRMADSVRMAKLPACRFGFFLSFEAHDFAANLGRYG